MNYIVPASSEEIIKASLIEMIRERSSLNTINLFLKNLYPKTTFSIPYIEITPAIVDIYKPKIIKKNGKSKVLPINAAFELRFMPGVNIKQETAKHLMEILTTKNSLFSFEGYGNKKRIFFRLAFNSRFKSFIQNSIKRIIPSVSVREVTSDFLDYKKLNVSEFTSNSPLHYNFSTLKCTPIDIAINTICNTNDFSGFQIMFSKTDQDFHKIFKGFYCIEYYTKKELSISQPINTPNNYIPSIIKDQEQKINPNNSFLYVAIRTFSTSKIILDQINAYPFSFQHGGKPLIKIGCKNYPKGALKKAIFKRKSHRYPLVMSSEEFSRILPLINIPKEPEKIHPALSVNYDLPIPFGMTKKENGIPLGTNAYEGEPRLIYPAKSPILNSLTTGNPGSGKSCYISYQILENIKMGLPSILIDPDGSTVDTTLKIIPKNNINDVVVLDFSKETFWPHWNFVLTSEMDSGKWASDIACYAFRSMFYDPETSTPTWGNNIEFLLQNCLYVLHKGGFQFEKIIILLSKEKQHYREKQEMLSHAKDNPEVLFFFHKFLPSMHYQMVLPTLSRLSTLLFNPYMARLFRLKGNKVNFIELIKKRQTILCKISTSISGEKAANLMGSLIFNTVWIEARKANLQTPLTIFIDEFHRFSPATIEEILTQGRKNNVMVRLSHQGLQQLPESLRGIMGSFQLLHGFQMNLMDAKTYSEFFNNAVDPHFLIGLKPRSMVIKSGGAMVTTATVPTLPIGNNTISNQIYKNSIEKYYTTGEAVEEKNDLDLYEKRKKFDEI